MRPRYANWGGQPAQPRKSRGSFQHVAEAYCRARRFAEKAERERAFFPHMNERDDPSTPNPKLSLYALVFLNLFGELLDLLRILHKSYRKHGSKVGTFKPFLSSDPICKLLPIAESALYSWGAGAAFRTLEIGGSH